MKHFFYFGIVAASINLFAKIHQLRVESSGLSEIRSGYVCNFDDAKRQVKCYKTSIADPEDNTVVVVAEPGEAYETCGLRPGEGNFLGTFRRSEEDDASQGLSQERAADSACSVWRVAKRPFKGVRLKKNR